MSADDGSSWSGRLMVLKDWSQDSNVFFRARMFEIMLLIQSGLGDSVLVARSISSSSGGTRKARSSRKFTLAERVDIARTGRPPEKGFLVQSECTSCSVAVSSREKPGVSDGLELTTYLNDAYLLYQKAPKSRVSRICVIELVGG